MVGILAHCLLAVHLGQFPLSEPQFSHLLNGSEGQRQRMQTVFLTLKTFRGSGVQLIARFSKIGIFFSISLSNAEAHGSPLSTNLAPKKKSLHKTLPLIDLIHFPILP